MDERRSVVVWVLSGCLISEAAVAVVFALGCDDTVPTMAAMTGTGGGAPARAPAAARTGEVPAGTPTSLANQRKAAPQFRFL